MMRGPPQQNPLISPPVVLPQYPQHPPYNQFQGYPHIHAGEMSDRPPASVTLGGRPLIGPVPIDNDNRFHHPHPGDPAVNHYHDDQYRHNDQASSEQEPSNEHRANTNKKKSRRPSIPAASSSSSQTHNRPQNPSPTHPSSNGKQRPNPQTQNQSDSPPAVLVREKKQKACANCRRAKLKCIVENGQTDCVRCKARKERCIFYPRSHDEDWQQTLTADVYTAVRHLSNLSNAVHHILHHLTAQGIVPPLPGSPLEYYDAPDRDLGVLQGWGAEKNREPGDKRKRIDEEDQSHHRRPSAPDYAQQGMPNFDRLPSQWTPTQPTVPLPPPPQYDPSLMRPNLPSSSSTMLPRPSLPEILPPLRHNQSTQIQLTPTSELDIMSSHGPLSGHFYQGSALPPPLSSAGDIPMPPPPPPELLMKLTSPTAALNTTPASLTNSSPVVAQDKDPWTVAQRSSSSNSIPTIGVGNITPELSLGAEPSSAMILHSRQDDPREDGDEVFGSGDGRPTIITKEIVPAKEAKILVEYFHDLISPQLYGYYLKLRHFPYLPEGPRVITPFILAVECLLASERVPALYPYHDALADHVLNVMLTSPAESWQTLKGSRESPEQVLGKAFGEDLWDPELGIGPEEIVGACVLAAFVKDQAKPISDYAFMWARGWTTFLKGLKDQGEQDASQMSLVEFTGMVPPLRRPSEIDMARVWLLSYVVAGQEVIDSGQAELGTLHDPSRWCRVLIPADSSPSSSPHQDPHDILLVFHAKLLSLIRAWNKDRSEMHRPSGEAQPSVSNAHKRLASRTNANLDWLLEDLKAYGLEPYWMKQIHLDWLNAKTMINSVASKNVYGGPDEESLRRASRSMAVDSALHLLDYTSLWDPPEALLGLPHAYYRMIARAASEVTEALTEVEQGSFDRSACPTTIKEVVPLIASVGNMLLLGGLPEGHLSRQVGTDLARHAENLTALDRYAHR